MEYDLLIRGATVIDGTSAPRFEADIAIRDGKIERVGSIEGPAKAEIRADGLVAAPGFIDAHTHDDRLMISAPEMAPKVSQGVTTVVAGNCGVSLAPTPRGMPRPVTPPIDIMDPDGDSFRFKTFADYWGGKSKLDGLVYAITPDATARFAKLQKGAALCAKLGLECHMGHGLSYADVAPIAAIPEVRELNIGHFLVGEAIFVGLDAAIREMRRIMDDARKASA